MAGLDVSSQALTEYAGFALQSFQEANKITDGMITYRYQPGTTSINVPKTINRTVSQAGSGGARLSIATNVDLATTVTVDKDTVAYDYVPYSAINTNGMRVEQNIAEQLGINIARARMDNYLSALLQGSFTNHNTITYDDDSADPVTLGTAVYGWFLAAMANLASAYVPEDNRFCVLNLKDYLALRTYAPAVSRDFRALDDASASAVNAPGAGFMIANVPISPAISVFNRDLTTDTFYTNMASKYKYNFATGTTGSGFKGVMWHKQALTVLEIEKVNANLTNEAGEQSWLAVVRYQNGCAVTRPEAVVSALGDA